MSQGYVKLNSSLVRGVIREAQEILARNLFDLALYVLRNYLQGETLANTLEQMTDEDLSRAVAGLLRVRLMLLQLVELDFSAEGWINLVNDLLEAFTAVEPLLIPAADRSVWEDGLALGWVAAVIIDELLAWARRSDGEASFE